MAGAIHSEAYHQMVAELRKVRLEIGLHQSTLGELVGKDQSFISNIERGERRVDILEFYALARAMKFEPAELYARITSGLTTKVSI
ncbi:helix-turn-helix transcriptional regulator [Sphingomonas sp.]|uniref:helix-turn-helix domain-containing protein n=1 Tax=Sphingomonas sp. TaxID=28214 RepID=UPI002EDBA7F5